MSNAGSINSLTSYINENRTKNNAPNESLLTSNTSEQQFVQDGQVVGGAEDANTTNYVSDNVVTRANARLSTEGVNSQEPVKEGFFNTGIENVTVNAMGNLEGPTIYTNGQLAHGLKYDDIVAAVKEGKHISDQSTAGAGRGDEFEGIYADYVKIQDAHDMNPTGVRSAEEIDEITKSLNGNTNLATHNLLTRAGASKAKVVLDPNGTVGVMEDNARRLPERERNHKIYATSHVIKIPEYSMDYVDQYQNLTNGGSGFAGAMSHNADDHVTGFGRNAAATSKIIADKAEESFSVAN